MTNRLNDIRNEFNPGGYTWQSTPTPTHPKDRLSTRDVPNRSIALVEPTFYDESINASFSKKCDARTKVLPPASPARKTSFSRFRRQPWMKQGAHSVTFKRSTQTKLNSSTALAGQLNFDDSDRDSDDCQSDDLDNEVQDILSSSSVFMSQESPISVGPMGHSRLIPPGNTPQPQHVLPNINIISPTRQTDTRATQESPNLIGQSFYHPEDKTSYFHQMFKVKKRLGQGSFGEVFHVQPRHECNSSRERLTGSSEYAVKKSLQPFQSKAHRDRKFEEVKKHQALPPHPNCVMFIQAWEEEGILYIQQELCQRTLEHEMKQKYENQRIPEHRVWDYMLDLLSGLYHLHSYQFMHLDIKPPNIFIGFDGRLKIGDFGLVSEEGVMESNNEEGDPRYMAQELLDNKFTCKADIFSLGVVILEIGTGLDPPQYGSLWHRLRSGGGIPLEFSMHVSPELHRVIVLMLQDWEKRPTAAELLQMHPICDKSRDQLNFSEGSTRSRSFISVNKPLAPTSPVGHESSNLLSSPMSSETTSRSITHWNIIPRSNLSTSAISGLKYISGLIGMFLTKIILLIITWLLKLVPKEKFHLHRNSVHFSSSKCNVCKKKMLKEHRERKLNRVNQDLLASFSDDEEMEQDRHFPQPITESSMGSSTEHLNIEPFIDADEPVRTFGITPSASVNSINSVSSYSGVRERISGLANSTRQRIPKTVPKSAPNPIIRSRIQKTSFLNSRCSPVISGTTGSPLNNIRRQIKNDSPMNDFFMNESKVKLTFDSSSDDDMLPNSFQTSMSRNTDYSNDQIQVQVHDSPVQYTENNSRGKPRQRLTSTSTGTPVLSPSNTSRSQHNSSRRLQQRPSTPKSPEAATSTPQRIQRLQTRLRRFRSQNED